MTTLTSDRLAAILLVSAIVGGASGLSAGAAPAPPLVPATTRHAVAEQPPAPGGQKPVVGNASPSEPASNAQIVRPGRPGEDSTVVSAAASARSASLPHTGADTAFMQGMIGHHAQALEMTALVYTNSQSEEMKRLAKRIEVSQLDEIAMMKDWLRARKESLPDEHAHHAGDHALMAGMLTQAEMKALAAARGAEFDRLFLQGMIKHHQGALTMVRELFRSPAAGQDAEIFAFASDVDADQAMEIDRMAAMLAALKERQQ